MTVKSRAELNTDADTFIQDNTTNLISAEDVRNLVKDLADSAFNLTTDDIDDVPGAAAIAGSGSAADLSAGIIPDARMPNLTGDVTTSEGAVATTIANDAVSNAKLADAAAYTLKGRNAGTSGDPSDIDITALTEKSTPHDDDVLLLVDTEASNAFKKVKKSSLAGDMGPAILANGSVSAQAQLNLDLPVAYNFFELYLYDISFNQNPYLYAAFSPDGGSSFYFDDANFDAYEYVYLHYGTGTGAGDGNSADTMAPLLEEFSVIDAIHYAKLIIYPGATGKNAAIMVHTRYDDDGTTIVRTADIRLVEATGRQNMIAILPLGNGDAPNSSADTITIGRYALVGVP